MFTGIVEALGRVAARNRRPDGMRIRVDAPFRVPPGASVAVDGVCLTALEGEGGLAFDVVPETLRRTTLGRLRRGDRVHLERARPAGGRLDGHVVQGHVDGTGKVESLKRRGGGVDLSVRLPADLAGLTVPQGSIALHGVSLTIAGMEGDVVRVALIPTTLRRTTLGSLRKGDRVNVEADVMAKVAAKAGRRGPGVTLELLRMSGFLGRVTTKSPSARR